MVCKSYATVRRGRFDRITLSVANRFQGILYRFTGSNMNYGKDWISIKWPLEVLDVNTLKSIEHAAKEPLKPNNGDGLINEIIQNSDQFPISFPINTIKMKELRKSFDATTLNKNIISTYPIINERTLGLFIDFLEYKRNYGSTIEKTLYNNINVLDLVDRMLSKRSVVFLNEMDTYVLLSNKRGSGGWESVGKANEKPPLVLQDCLSYDEMKLSALLYVSGRTVFINNGSRRNLGIVDKNPEQNIQKTGIIIGLIGTRMEKERVMEYEECLITNKQNSIENGFGENANVLELDPKVETRYLWRHLLFNFYKADSLTFDAAKLRMPCPDVVLSDEVKTTSSLIYLNEDHIFNNELFSKRLSISFDILLLEANERAQEDQTTAYIHVIGIGLGVWKVSSHQTNVFVRTFIARIVDLLPQLRSVADVHFAYFHDIIPEFATDGMFLKDDNHPLGGIKVHISRREPSSKLTGEHSHKLLVESYAWDGNAHPGNEFWTGSLAGSGDPAAACSTQVAELHNANINKEFVTGRNLHIASRFGVKHISEYCRLAA